MPAGGLRMPESSESPTLRTSLERWVDRLARRLKRYYPDPVNHLPAVVFDTQAGTIDDGNYGDPTVDTRPDWLKADLDGWQH